jgi:catechol 2,3-dioxygenase-like lactoylglutathione lyase family enzyme
MPPSSETKASPGVCAVFGAKKVFSSADGVAVDVRDIDAAQLWYAEKLGMHYSSSEVDAEVGNMVLGYSADQIFLSLVKISGQEKPDSVPGHPPIIFAKKLTAAHEYLASRSVDVGPLQQDSGGNHFFRFRDLEGNELEVCQES